MVPWGNYAQLLEKQRTYNPALFKNECLGMPTTLGELIVTRAELEACCMASPMVRTMQQVPSGVRHRLVAGIDWGGGSKSRTVLAIGYMDDHFRFVVLRLERFAAREDPNFIFQEISQRCQQFGIQIIAADGNGSGHYTNRLLIDQLNRQIAFYAIFYAPSGQAPRQEGALWYWTVNRSASIGMVFSRVKKRSLLFPRVQDSGSFLDEIGCEIVEYDDSNRSIPFTHPASQPDDALHALNYALLVSTREHAGRQMHGVA
jgi:hypothetical protein